MAIAYFSFERFKKALKEGYNYTISYEGKKYNIGLRYLATKHYYYLNCETLEFKIFYSVKDLLKNFKIGDKTLERCWDDVIIIKEYFWFKFKDEVELLEKYRDSLRGKI